MKTLDFLKKALEHWEQHNVFLPEDCQFCFALYTFKNKWHYKIPTCQDKKKDIQDKNIQELAILFLDSVINKLGRIEVQFGLYIIKEEQLKRIYQDIADVQETEEYISATMSWEEFLKEYEIHLIKRSSNLPPRT